jgi:hypothetical protein
MVNSLQLEDAKRAPRPTGHHKNTMRMKYNQEQLTEEDVATMPTIQHDHLPNGVRDNPGIYTL